MTDFPNEILPPAWISYRPKMVDGLDLLGLRQPVQMIGNLLFDGLTTVTPTVRYLSFRTWLIERFTHTGGELEWSPFLEYVKAAEAAFVFGNLEVNQDVAELVGLRKARNIMRDPPDRIQLEPLVQQPAFLIYANPSDQLGLTSTRSRSIPQLVSERALPVASAFDKQVQHTNLARRISKGAALAQVTRREWAEFGRAADVRFIGSEERAALLAAIVPEKPSSEDERARVATFGLLLALARRLERMPGEYDVFREAVARQRSVPGPLQAQLDRWIHYLARDCIAVAHEATLAAILGELEPSSETGEQALSVVNALMADRTSAQEVLVGLGLADEQEDVYELEMVDLRERVRACCSSDVIIESGLRRWRDGFSEWDVYQRASGRGSASLAAVVVAWLLAEYRCEVLVDEDMPDAKLLSHEGRERLGLRQVVIPCVRSWLEKPTLFVDAMLEAAFCTVDQHLRIAALRMAQDPTRDVSLLVREGQVWRHQQSFANGRTASRLDVAVGWMEQLELINDSGLTATGAGILDRALAAIETGGS